MENWMYIVGYEGLYQVSTLGRVRSLDRVITRGGLRSGDLPLKGKIKEQTSNKDGYKKVTLCARGLGETKLVHRIVAEAFLPNKYNLPLVLHRDDVPYNNRVDNLKWGTQQDNMDDMVSKGRQIRGEDHPGTSVTDLDVLFIRYWCNTGYGDRAVSEVFNIGRKAVNRIKLRRTWRHV